MRRVTRPDGTVIASQWDFAKGIPMLAMFWDTVLAVAPSDAAHQTAANCMNVAYPDDRALRDLWGKAGLTEIATERHEVCMTFAAFEDYWVPFLSNVTPTGSYAGKLEDSQVIEIKN
jgi:hypothetical protein